MKKLLISLLVITPFVAIGILWSLPYKNNIDKSGAGSLTESESAANSASSVWWLRSGGKISINGDEWQSIQSDLAPSDTIRKSYLRNNPLDTDNGFHPQNIFKLFSQAVYSNPSQELHFFINKVNVSPSPNRSGTNGIFLISRYQNANRYYYAGLQADGKAVIKKRLGNDTSTIAEKRVYDYADYDRDARPNLLPAGAWLGLRTEISTRSGIVSIKLYGDLDGTGEWKLLLDTTDSGGAFGEIINEKSPVGIRADFMDISFSRYRVSEE